MGYFADSDPCWIMGGMCIWKIQTFFLYGKTAKNASYGNEQVSKKEKALYRDKCQRVFIENVSGNELTRLGLELGTERKKK